MNSATNTAAIESDKLAILERDALAVLSDGLGHTTCASDGLWPAFRALAKTGACRLTKSGHRGVWFVRAA